MGAAGERVHAKKRAFKIGPSMPGSTAVSTATTDPEGYFEMDVGQNAVVITVQPTDPLLAFAVVPECRGGQFVPVILEKGLGVYGAVTLDGKAVSGAALRLYTKEDYGKFARQETWTDKAGAFRFEQCSPGEYVAEVLYPGLAITPHPFSLKRENVYLDILLELPLHLSGVVVDERSGRPIPEAEVDLTWNFSAPTTTDPSGQFSLRGPANAATDRVFSRAKGFSMSHTAIPADPSDTSELMIELAPGAAARGRVLSWSLSPLEGARVVALGFPDTNHHVDWRETSTSRDGTFGLDGLSRDSDYALLVEHAEYGGVLHAFPSSPPIDSALELGDITLSESHTIRVQVVAATGEGVSGCEIRAKRILPPGCAPILERANNWLSSARRAWTSHDGTAIFRNLNEGEFEVTASIDARSGSVWRDSSAVTLGSELRDAEVVFRLNADMSISGIVLESSGGPARGAIVQLFRSGGMLTGTKGMLSTKADGQFRFAGVDPGEYRIVVAPGSAQVDAGEQSAGKSFEGIFAGQENLILRLPEAKPIRGYLLDANDAFASKYYVHAVDSNLVQLAVTLTDDSGAFTLPSIAETVDLLVFPTLAPLQVGGPRRPDNTAGLSHMFSAVQPGSSDLVLRLPYAIE